MKLYEKYVKEVVVEQVDFLRILRHSFPEIPSDAHMVVLPNGAINIAWSKVTNEEELVIEDLKDEEDDEKG